MMNITDNIIEDKGSLKEYNSFKLLASKRGYPRLIRIFYAFGILLLIIMFLPWTQNIRSQGRVTALRPDQRPQTIQSVIAGKIEKWYVAEGQFVKKGDTILFLSEIKAEYLDPDLVENTKSQLEAKESSVKSYMGEVNAFDNQIDALISTRNLKIEQSKNKLIQANLKVQSDSIDLKAAELNHKIAKEQYDRMEELHKDGLRSLTDLETRRLKLQETQAKMISAQNKLITSRNEVLNAKIEIRSTEAEYNDKIAKSNSDKYSALSSLYDAEATVTKLQNQYVNYSIRSGMYYIMAPQDGYITKAIQSGVGETIKEGTEIFSIMPANYELAVEMYVKAIDIPLLQRKQHVQIQFDGWPAIIFSGWPGVTYGTYGGEIVAIDNFVSQNGKFRVLISHDRKYPKWPEQIKLGAGANTITLLKEVPVWYEIWRKINGFPPDYYKNPNPDENASKK